MKLFFENILKLDGGKYIVFDLKNFIIEKNKITGILKRILTQRFSVVRICLKIFIKL